MTVRSVSFGVVKCGRTDPKDWKNGRQLTCKRRYVVFVVSSGKVHKCASGCVKVKGWLATNVEEGSWGCYCERE